MIRVGEAPYLECSSRGDKRFSSFYAKVNDRSIEDQYQAAKVFADGSTGLTWRQAKGKKAVNMNEVSILYEILWTMYLKDHPKLIQVLQEQSGLSDMFGQEGCNCQATTLWKVIGR